ncbi:MAG: hypothetical protein GY854_06090, partial [Deltaproteobacteria bacterium]|nr:hypothetical protein [Deltaproteobacteria bacterium]
MPANFDTCRGNQQWINNLRKLRKDFPPGAFALWSEQENLTNVGHDLNLFRQQIVEQSFMPIYEAGVKDVNLDLDGLLSRFGDRLNPNVYPVAKETLEEEWRRWDSVRLQLTRDGAVHVTLVRELTTPYPLMKLLDELLGLERELNGGELLELSVQWELALAATQAFLRQVAGERFPEIPALLGLKWEGFSQIKETGSIYPLRDRYVTYLLRKICNCHSDKARSNDERRQISIVDLEPLQNVATLGDDAQREAYSYGCEIASLLEGVMIRSSAVPAIGRFPALKLREIQQLLADDLSSWRNELFVASLDSAILLYQATNKVPVPGSDSAGLPVTHADEVCRGCGDGELRTVRELHFPQRLVPYEDYWKCLALGLQYIIELRWGAQWIARSTTKDLGDLADLMEGTIEDRPPKKVKQLVQNLALTTRLLSHLRDASIPLSIAGAG